MLSHWILSDITKHINSRTSKGETIGCVSSCSVKCTDKLSSTDQQNRNSHSCLCPSHRLQSSSHPPSHMLSNNPYSRCCHNRVITACLETTDWRRPHLQLHSKVKLAVLCGGFLSRSLPVLVSQSPPQPESLELCLWFLCCLLPSHSSPWGRFPGFLARA